jgi:hypothetical protein
MLIVLLICDYTVPVGLIPYRLLLQYHEYRTSTKRFEGVIHESVNQPYSDVRRILSNMYMYGHLPLYSIPYHTRKVRKYQANQRM